MLACNYFDRYMSSVGPGARSRPRFPSLTPPALSAAHILSSRLEAASTLSSRIPSVVPQADGAAVPANSPLRPLSARRTPRSGAQTLTPSFPLPSPQTCDHELPVSQEGKRTSIQMIASTCLLISAKFFDRKLPPLSELEKVHQQMNSPEEFAELELRILEKLQWKLHMPLPHVFTDHLRVLCKGAPFTQEVLDRMYFFIDLSVYGYQFLAYMPCTIAAAAIITAWKFSCKDDAVAQHIAALAGACELEPEMLSTCANALVGYYQTCFPEAGIHPAVFVPIPSDAPTQSRTTSSCSETDGTAEADGETQRDAPETPDNVNSPSSSVADARLESPFVQEMAAAAGTVAPLGLGKADNLQEGSRLTPDSIIEVHRVA